MDSQAERSAPFWTIIAAVFFGNFMASLSTTSINVALPVFMKDFDAPLHTVQWMMSGFMLATGVIAPIIGFMGDKLSYKRLYVFALMGFTITSALCTIAWSIESLIVLRILQGLCSGIIMPTTMTVIYQVIPKEKQALGIGLWSVSSMLAPAFGPTIGGWLTEGFGWKSLFVMNVPIGLTAIVIALKFIPYYRISKGIKLDVIGFVTVIVSTSALLFSFSQSSSWGWGSWKTLSLLAVGVIILIYFLIRTLRVSSPLLNLRVFKIPRFTYSLIVNSIITISLYAGTLLTPLYMQEIKHASTFHTGLVMLPGTLTMAIVSFMVGKIYDKVGPFRLLVVGIVIMAVSTWSLSLIHVSTATSYIVIWLAVRYVGIAFSYMPITNAGMTAVPQQYSGHASAVTNWIRQGTAAFAISIFSAMLTSRTVAHMKELGPAAQGGSEQGLSMAIQDVFVIGTILVVVALPVTFLLLKKQKPIQESALVPTASA